MAAISRRQVISASASAGLLALGGTRAEAQGAADWPSRPVRVVVNYGPGGGTDAATRPFTDRLSRMLGRQFVVDNRERGAPAANARAPVPVECGLS